MTIFARLRGGNVDGWFCADLGASASDVATCTIPRRSPVYALNMTIAAAHLSVGAGKNKTRFDMVEFYRARLGCLRERKMDRRHQWQ